MGGSRKIYYELTEEGEVLSKIEKVRGASYMNLGIKKKQIATLTSLATLSHVQKEIQTILLSSKNNFKSQEVTEVVNAYQSTLLSSSPLPPPKQCSC